MPGQAPSAPNINRQGEIVWGESRGERVDIKNTGPHVCYLPPHVP